MKNTTKNKNRILLATNRGSPKMTFLTKYIYATKNCRTQNFILISWYYSNPILESQNFDSLFRFLAIFKRYFTQYSLLHIIRKVF